MGQEEIASAFAERLRQTIVQKEETAQTEAERQRAVAEAARRAFETAEEAAEELVSTVLHPLVEEFYAVLEAEGVLCRGDVRRQRPRAYRDDFGRLATYCRALGTARGRRRYEVRIDVRAGDDGVQLAGECVHLIAVGYPEPPRREPLAELRRSRFAAGQIDRAAARAWCEETLKRAAEAIMEANFAPGPIPIVAAPFVAPPVFAGVDIPSTA